MNSSFFLSVHFIWILLVLINFIIQLMYFFNDESLSLFRAKKISTPVLLFSAMLLVILGTRSFPVMPCLVLAAMGLGELGIEGSGVVEASDGEGEGNTPVSVLLAGVLFLLVNLFFGVWLILQGTSVNSLIVSGLVSVAAVTLMLVLTFRFAKPGNDTRVQMMLYSAGLVILSTGFLTDVFRGLSLPGLAAGILTLSDSLVLVRMGANFSKKNHSGFGILLTFLVVILLLYYLYMAVLIQIGSPFPLAIISA